MRSSWDTILAEVKAVAGAMGLQPTFAAAVAQIRKRKRFHDDTQDDIIDTSDNSCKQTPDDAFNPLTAK